MHLTIPGTAEAVRQALQQLVRDEWFCSLPEDLRGSTEIVLAEVLNNIVEHAYAECCGEITFDLSMTPQGLACRVTDQGAPMPGLCLPKGRFQALGETADLPEGGFGWFLIRNLTEGLEYHHHAGVNRLSFRMVEEQPAR